jgi:hypothetical protein
MIRFQMALLAFAVLASGALPTRAADGVMPRKIDGLISKPSSYSIDVSLDRFEAALKQHGFMIFARLDHTATAACNFGSPESLT